MPDQTKTLIADGSGDFSTLQAALTAADVGGGYYKIEIQDNSEYSYATFTTVIGVPTSVNRTIITARSTNRHAGVAGETHARIRNTTNGQHCLTIGVSYTQIEFLQIKQDYPGSSLEGVRFNAGVAGVILSSCIIYTDLPIGSQDGVYAGNWSVQSVYIYNCIIYGWGRAGIHAQVWNTGSAQTWFIDSCTIPRCGTDASSSGHGGISIRASDASASVTMAVYNTFADTAIGNAFDSYNGGGDEIWLGTNNACTDASLTAAGLTVGAKENLTITDLTQSSGNYAVFKSVAAGSEDYSLLDNAAGNVLVDSGTNRIGNEPDSRQDFSVDISGVSRPQGITFDIGVFEYPILFGITVLQPSSIDRQEAFGVPALNTNAIALQPQAIPTLEQLGSAQITTGQVALTPAAIASQEVISSPTIQIGSLIITPSGLASAELMGNTQVTTGINILSASSIASAEALGAPALNINLITLNPQGIGTAELLGSMQITAGSVTLAPIAISSQAAVANPIIQTGTFIIVPHTITSGEIVNGALVIPSASTITANAIASGEMVGNPALTNLIAMLQPSGIATAEAFGGITIIGGELFMDWLVGELHAYSALNASLNGFNALRGNVKVHH